MSVIRALRLDARASQVAFAARLGVSLESYRAWDAGRREPPSEILATARRLAVAGPDDRPLSLPALALLLGVSVFRLREAARDGRLAVTYERRVMFGHPIPRATRAAGEAYKTQFYGKKARWVARPTPPRVFATPPKARGSAGKGILNDISGDAAKKGIGAGARAAGSIVVGHSGDIGIRWMRDEAGNLFKIGSETRLGATMAGKALGGLLAAANEIKGGADALVFAGGVIACGAGF